MKGSLPDEKGLHWPHAPTQAQRDGALRDAIERIVLEFPGYGYRRVTEELHRQQWTVNHKRVLRIMRQEALLCQLQRAWIVTTDSRHGLRTYPNLVANLSLTRPNQAWVADITYVRWPSSFLYLACVLDTWSRRCVGWQLSRTIDTHLTLAAEDDEVVISQHDVCHLLLACPAWADKIPLRVTTIHHYELSTARGVSTWQYRVRFACYWLTTTSGR